MKRLKQQLGSEEKEILNACESEKLSSVPPFGSRKKAVSKDSESPCFKKQAC